MWNTPSSCTYDFMTFWGGWDILKVVRSSWFPYNLFISILLHSAHLSDKGKAFFFSFSKCVLLWYFLWDDFSINWWWRYRFYKWKSSGAGAGKEFSEKWSTLFLNFICVFPKIILKARILFHFNLLSTLNLLCGYLFSETSICTESKKEQSDA